MAVTLSAMFKAYQTALATALSIDVILGYPDLGRGTVSLPVAGLTFQDDDYARVTRFQQQPTRLGQQQPVGRSAKAAVTVYAANEWALLGLLDTLSSAKTTLTYVTIDGTKVTITYGSTVRLPVDLEETQLRYAAATELTFSWL